jgi:pimeloyl-ACP methyl ester carboxylesterase
VNPNFENPLEINTKDGFKLNALGNFSVPSSPAVIFCHGMSVDLNAEGIFVRAYRQLAEKGFNVLRFDFRAHGKSSGESSKDFTVSGELFDLEAAVQHALAHGFSSLGLAGASFGGSIVALYAASHPVQALLLANPVLSYHGILEPQSPWAKSVFSNIASDLDSKGYVSMNAGWSELRMGRKFFEEMAFYDPGLVLRAYSGPLLAIHGDMDDMVLLEPTRAVFDAIPNPMKHFEVVHGSSHGFHAEPFESQVTNLSVGFFGRSLS